MKGGKDMVGEEQRMEELDMSKCKISPFLGNCKPKVMVDTNVGAYKERYKGDPCESWVALKSLMRERYVPPSYTRDLHNKLQRLYQGYKSVEEYHKEMKMDSMRT
ncbi:hypothetical protein CR513_13586, partial [Mucuna pruriens]